MTAVVLEWSRIVILLRGRDLKLKSINWSRHMVHLISCRIVITAGLCAELLKFSLPHPYNSISTWAIYRILRINGTWNCTIDCPK